MLKFIKNNIRAIIIILIVLINVIVLLNINYQCPWKVAFNIDCAGCGGTRMFLAILDLDFYQAFRFNPLLFILLVGSIIYFIYVIICKILKVNYFKFSVNYLWLLLVLVIGFTILRNIEIFSFLKPVVV